MGQTVERAPWELKRKPRFVTVGGMTIQVFTRAELAKALNRSVETIRAMEHKRVLCQPRLKTRLGWNYYTRDQIEDLIRLAAEEDVLDPKFHRPFSERFKVEAHKILSRIPR
jgi:hypothetical protein